MAAFRSRLFSRDDLVDLLGLVKVIACSRWLDPTYMLSSDVAWQLPGSRGD